MDGSILDVPLNKLNYAELVIKPESLALLLNKYIKVNLIKNCSYSGFLQAIDPITNSMILLVPHDGTLRTSLIPGHAVVTVSELSPPPHIKLPEHKPISTPTIDTERKAKVIEWLKQNLLPVSESGDKILFGNASLLPPYTVADICTNNPMVAMEMKKILERMPEDFELSKLTS